MALKQSIAALLCVAAMLVSFGACAQTQESEGTPPQEACSGPPTEMCPPQTQGVLVLNDLFAVGYMHGQGILVVDGKLRRKDVSMEAAVAAVRAWLLNKEGVTTNGDRYVISDAWRERDIWALMYAYLVGDEDFCCPAWFDVPEREAEITALLARHADND